MKKHAVSNSRTTLRLVIFSATLLLFSCVNHDFDLSDGVNTQMTVGGDSLSLPIGKINPILLKTLIDSMGISIIEKTSDDDLTINIQGSNEINIGTIEPVILHFDPIKISGSRVEISDIKFPVLTIPEISYDTIVNIPSVSINTQNLDLPEVNERFNQIIEIPPLLMPLSGTSKTERKTKSSNIIIDLEPILGNRSFKPSFNFEFNGNPIDYIHTIEFKNSTVTIEMDKTDINSKGFISQYDTVRSFILQFPKEYQLSSPIGGTINKATNSFVVKDAIVPAGKNFKASFVLKALDLTSAEMILSQQTNKALRCNKDVNYSFEYKFSGEINAEKAMILSNSKLNLDIHITATPKLDDLTLTTKNITFDETISGKGSIKHSITELPSEISEINTIILNESAELQLKLNDPNLSPLKVSNGYCTIQFPSFLVFKPISGLNLSNNTYTIPKNSLFDTHKLPLKELNINKKVTNQTAKIDAEINYALHDMKIAGTAKLSQLQNIGTTRELKFFISSNEMTVKDATFKTKQLNIEIPKQKTEINIDQFISNEVKKIYTVGLKSPAKINLKFNIKNLPSNVDSIFFQNYIIKHPKELKFATGEVNSKNEIILNEGFSINKGFSKTIHLQGLDFGTSGLDIVNGMLKLNKEISMEGIIYLNETSFNLNDVEKAEYTNELQLDDIVISSVTGKAAPAVEPIKEIIKLDLPSTILSGDNNLDFKNPYIVLDFGNSLGIPFNIDLNLTARKNQKPISDASFNAKLAIAGAKTIGEYTFSKFWITNDTTNIHPDKGYKTIIIPELPNLLKTLPDEIAVVANATVKDTVHQINIYSPLNAMKIDYKLNIPLDFGNNFKFSYKDTLSNIQDELSAFIKYVKQIDIVAIVKNGIPLGLNLTLIPLDEDKKPIPATDLFVAQDFLIFSCNSNGESVETIASLGIKEITSGAFAKINAFEYSISATRGNSLIPLNSNQEVEIELRIKIPKGLTIDPAGN